MCFPPTKVTIGRYTHIRKQPIKRKIWGCKGETSGIQKKMEKEKAPEKSCISCSRAPRPDWDRKWRTQEGFPQEKWELMDKLIRSNKLRQGLNLWRRAQEQSSSLVAKTAEQMKQWNPYWLQREQRCCAKGKCLQRTLHDTAVMSFAQQ